MAPSQSFYNAEGSTVLFFHKWKNLEGQAGLKQMQSNPPAVVRFLSVPVSQRQLLH